MRKNNKKGFTLVELLVVIAILAILASVAVVGYTAFVDKANKSAAETEAHPIDAQIEASLMINDAAYLGKKADNTEIWVVKGANGYTATTTEPAATVEVEDLSANFDATMLARLTVGADNKLTYTNNGYAVDVDAGEGTKAQ